MNNELKKLREMATLASPWSWDCVGAIVNGEGLADGQVAYILQAPGITTSAATAAFIAAANPQAILDLLTRLIEQDARLAKKDADLNKLISAVNSAFNRASSECRLSIDALVSDIEYLKRLPSDHAHRTDRAEAELTAERERRKRAEARLATENRVNEKLKKSLFEAESELIQALAKLDMED